MVEDLADRFVSRLERKPASHKSRGLRLLALVEAEHVSGPVKNLLAFAREASDRSGLGDQGIELLVGAFRRGGRTPKDLVTALDDAGIEYRWIDERFRYDPSIFSYLRKLVSELQVDLIQTHGVKSHFVVRVSQLYRQRPWIAFHHGYTSTDLKMRLYNQCDRWSLQRALGVVAVSRSTAGQLARFGVAPETVRIVRNEISRPEVSQSDPLALRRSLGLPDSAPLVLSVGRLSREKGHWVLVRALAAAARDGRDGWRGARLVIAGEGPERSRLERQIRRLGLERRVFLVGHRSDVPCLLTAADLFILPSFSEGSPNALLEALECGAPVVASDIGGVREIVEGGREAVLVDAGDHHALSKAVASLLADAERRRQMVQRGRELLRRQRSGRRRTRRLMEIYADLLGTFPSSLERVQPRVATG